MAETGATLGVTGVPVDLLQCGTKTMEGLLYWASLVLGPVLCSPMGSICAGVKAIAVGFRGAWLSSEEEE